MESQNTGKLSFFSANLLYMIVMVLFVTLGYIVQNWDFKYGILVTEFLLIALPVLIYTMVRTKTGGGSLKKELRINGLGVVDTLLIVITFVSAYFVAVFINILGEILVSRLGKLIVPDIPLADNPSEYIVLLLVIAGSAGLCEELLFRGYILRAYEKLGMWQNITITALLFSLLHLNIQNILAPFFLGLLLGFVVYKTNSILAGMLGHFINNAISVTWGYVIMNLPFYKNMNVEQVQAGMNTESLISAAILFGIILPFAGTIMFICLKAISDRHPEAAANTAAEGLAAAFGNIRRSWPLLVCLLIFIGMMTLEIVYIVSGSNIINL